MSEYSLFDYRLRGQQAEIMGYDGGRLGVSAVPGSGKTLTLALLAARLIIEGRIGQESEVLVVTVQNSAVANISQRIRMILREQGSFPAGFRVCTLHKLASDIVRLRHDLAGVEEGFAIVDSSESARMMHNAADAWIAGNRIEWLSYLPATSQSGRARLEDLWRIETEKLGRLVTKRCKHMRLSPEQADALLRGNHSQSPWLPIGIALYERYQRYLQARSGLDFDDLIWRAIETLGQDATFLEGLRQRWPYILEDEAQDSSPLQEQILEQLAGTAGNWIRMGDPNQSINSTFTSADPRYFRRFILRDDVDRQLLPQSGRCAPPIIELANHLVAWTCREHPEPAIREMAFERQFIRPTDADDAQQNPPANESHLAFSRQPFPDVEALALRVAHWSASYVKRFAERTIAVLCPAAWQGSEVVKCFEQMGNVPYEDLMRSTPRTRSVTQVLAAACKYLAIPTRQKTLATLFAVLSSHGHLGQDLDPGRVNHLSALLRSLAPDQLLFPHGVASFGDLLPHNIACQDDDITILQAFAELVSRWVRASSLPIDQLVMTIAQDILVDEADLAIAHTAATSLRSAASMHLDWRLRDFGDELQEVAKNRRALAGLSLADAAYQTKPGQIVITTMHRAKGLEWDAVYIMCLDSLEFPDTCDDAFRDELYFLPGRAPALEATRLLERLAGAEFATPAHHSMVEQARLEYISERLRLLYVGITRAKRNLAFTWSERNGSRAVRPAGALLELMNYRPTEKDR